MRKAMIRVQAGSLEQSLADTGAAFKRAWATGEYQGEEFVFDSTEALFRAITPCRWEMMGMLQRLGPMSLRALARELGRDIKNVHADVAALKEIGLIEDHEQGIWVPFQEIEAHLRLAA